MSDDELERLLLQSTSKKKDVSGLELHIDLTNLKYAHFHAVGRFIGAIEGFLRRGGSVRIIEPPTRATDAEAHLLREAPTPAQPEAARRNYVDTAQLVQSRSRARRFLERVGFAEAARCSHLGAMPIAFESTPNLSGERLPADARLETSPRSERKELIDVVPFRWIRVGSESDVSRAIEEIGSTLVGLGVKGRVHNAVDELTQNVYDHSLHGEDGWRDTAPPHILFGAAVRQSASERYLEVLIVDGGVGIPDTLKSSYKNFHGKTGSQSDIVAYAFEPISTRKYSVEGSARGLAVVLNEVRNAQGELRVRSGSGYVVVRNGQVLAEARPGAQLGTSFSLSLPMNNLPVSHPINHDSEAFDVSTISVDVALLRQGGRSASQIVTANAKGTTHHIAIIFIEPGCQRYAVEQTLVRYSIRDGVLLVASIDGLGAVLRDQLEAIASANLKAMAGDVLVLDGLEPVPVCGAMEPRVARGLVRAVVKQLEARVAEAVSAVADATPEQPQLSWSLEVAPKWIDPQDLLEPVLVRTLAPLVMAMKTALKLSDASRDGQADLAILDIVVTDEDLTEIGRALMGWLGATHLRQISIPQEPDEALFSDEIEAASVILTSVIHGGGATVPIVRGLLAGGRQSIALCCVIDGRPDSCEYMAVAGHQIPVVSAVDLRAPAPEFATKRLNDKSLATISVALDGGRSDSEFHEAVARSPGALSLGHFHSENRAWMSAVIWPSAIANPSTAVGRLILDRLVQSIQTEVDVLSPDSTITVSSLNRSTELTQHIREALETRNEKASNERSIHVLVDWGSLTGETVVRGALREANKGPAGVIVAVGVDRAFLGAHHLLSRSNVCVFLPPEGRLFGDVDDLEEKQVRISFVKAVAFPRDHRSKIDCPLCATERSLVALRSMPTPPLNSRLRVLRVRTSSDPPRAETSDGFDCPMPPDEVARFLIWRDIVHQGTSDKPLAHGVTLRLESEDEPLTSIDLVALSRNIVLNPDLLRRRPWSSPRFRHALANALNQFVLSSGALAISSSMARQLVTVLRMSSKMAFGNAAGRIYHHWKANDVREELELALATILRRNVSNYLLERASVVVAEFENAWDAEVPQSIGVLKAEIRRLEASRHLDGGVQTRWRDAHRKLENLSLHTGLGDIGARLPVIVSSLMEQRPKDRKPALRTNVLNSVKEIEHFVKLDYPEIRVLIEDELGPLVQRHAAERLPSKEDWLKDLRALEAILDSPDVDSGSDAQMLVDRVLSRLNISPGSKTFAALALTAISDVCSTIDDVIEDSRGSDCVIARTDQSARILFPKRPLHGLISQLVANASKHRRDMTVVPEVFFHVLPEEEDPTHRYLRIGYKHTRIEREPNKFGGLSHDQWGGALAAFGGDLRVALPSSGESFAVEAVFLRPWGGSL